MVDHPPVVGVLMLDTRFPRFPGDIGNPASIAGPSRYRRVPRATVGRVVGARAVSASLLAAFVAAGHELVADGATLIVTSCGFLHAAQDALAHALPVPVATSSLVLLPRVHARYGGGGPIGVLTFDARALGPVHLGAARALPLVVQGMEDSAYFHAMIAEDRPDADRAGLERDAIRAARTLATRSPAAVVLECTNLSPYRNAIADALGGVPVFDLHDAIAALVHAPPEA